MSSKIQEILSGSFSVSLATRIAQRQHVLSMQQVMSRLVKFAIGGVIGVIASVAMFVLARTGVVQLEHTRLLVTLAFVSGLAVALGSLLASLTLLWDGLLGQYARRLAAESELAEIDYPAPLTMQVAEGFDELVVAIEGETTHRHPSSSSGAPSNAEELRVPMADKHSRAVLAVTIADIVRMLSESDDLRISKQEQQIVRKILKLSEPGVVHNLATYGLLIGTLLRQARQFMEPASSDPYKKRPHA